LDFLDGWCEHHFVSELNNELKMNILPEKKYFKTVFE